MTLRDKTNSERFLAKIHVSGDIRIPKIIKKKLGLKPEDWVRCKVYKIEKP